MSRMNNQARSLRIISQQNGWDPDEIVDTHFNPGPSKGIYDLYHERNTPFESNTYPIPAAAAAPDADHPGSDRAGWNKPDASRETPKHTNGANPYPGMPGSK